jgi:hypothetical protein
MNSAVATVEAPVSVSASEALFARARKVMPGGVSRNAVLRRPHPFYVERGEGCYATDIEGVRRIDFSNNMTSQIHSTESFCRSPTDSVEMRWSSRTPHSATKRSMNARSQSA